MKTLPKEFGHEEILSMSMEEALQFKNKFLRVEKTTLGFGVVFYINPGQSYTKHQASATKKVKSLTPIELS